MTYKIGSTKIGVHLLREVLYRYFVIVNRHTVSCNRSVKLVSQVPTVFIDIDLRYRDGNFGYGKRVRKERIGRAWS